MSARRVLLFSDAQLYAGAERYLVELARGLPKDRWAVEVVCSESEGVDTLAAELTDAGLPVKRLPEIPTLKARGAFLKVARYFATHRADILHFNLTDPRSCNGAMTAARMAMRGRFVCTEHLPTSTFDDRPLPFRHRLAARSTAATIVNTAAGRVAMQARPHHNGSVTVIPNGIPDPGDPTPEQRAAARAELGFDPHHLLVGWVGRFAEQKDPDLMLEGIRRVHDVIPDVRFALIGDGPLFHATEARINELEIGAVTRCYGFRLDAAELLCGLDVLVNTSRYEGMPFTILEAMFRRVPVVGTRIAGNEQLIAHLASGVTYAQQDGDALGDALHVALGDRDRMLRFGRVARERALLLHSLEGMCARTAQVYDDTLSGQ
ncbi:MAG: glycosyltransferase family 4 protein [Planctomycetota bacterium]|nr:glycosyltransferase family 4 protein [Planctomycetota bacterium]